jgi:glycosyltransferase involved in cell wall biosynthesis
MTMLENRDIIAMCGDWNRHPGSIQHITEVLVRRNRVLWVSGIPLRSPRLHIYDFRRIAEKGRKMLSTWGNSYDHSIPVTEVHPFFIPYYDIPAIRRFNDKQLRSLLLKKIRELGFKDFVVLASNPMTAGVIGTLGESSSHYLCIDDYGANEGSFRCLGELELEMLQRVDSSFCMSDVLVKTRIPKSGEVNFFPEGVDLKHFKVTGNPPSEVLALIQKPVVGYCGLLASWVDFELIAKCAIAYPHVSFVVLGAAKRDISVLTKQPNIKCLGHIPYEVLPRYMEMFDVGLIPRVINRLTVAMNPLKLLEYLAMELPIVSTNLPEVKKFRDFAFVAEDHDEFVRLLGDALRDNAPERKRLRRAHAERFSWQSIVDRMSDVIQTIEERKGG